MKQRQIYRGIHGRRAGSHWLHCVRFVIGGLAKLTVLLWIVNLVGTEMASVSTQFGGALFSHAKAMAMELISTLSEFDWALDLLEGLYFELPIFLLLALVADNLIVIVRVVLLPGSGLQSVQSFALLIFRFIDMSRDLIQLYTDYGMFRPWSRS